MITRVFIAEVKPELAKEFEEKFRTISVALVKSQEGLISLKIGRPATADSNSYVMISVWEDTDSIKKFAGENWNEAVIPSGMERFISSCRVYHFKRI